jgi:hypothetical protein
VKGHQHIVEMRLERHRPELVRITVDEEPPPAWEENPQAFERFPQVFISPGEQLHRLDLRWVVGLPVIVACSGPLMRMVEAHAAVMRAKPEFVISTLYDARSRAVTYLTDSRNRYTWQTQTG